MFGRAFRAVTAGFSVWFRVLLAVIFVVASAVTISGTTAALYGDRLIELVTRVLDLTSKPKEPTRTEIAAMPKKTKPLVIQHRPRRTVPRFRYRYIQVQRELYVATSYINLRASPAGRVIGEVNLGEVLFGEGRLTKGPTVTWIEVSLRNRRGWVAARYIKNPSS